MNVDGVYVYGCGQKFKNRPDNHSYAHIVNSCGQKFKNLLDKHSYAHIVKSIETFFLTTLMM